jgi:hypothetical protein
MSTPATRAPGQVPLRYVPYHELGDTPNVVVDGAPGEGTVLAISHWPGTPCPPGLQADLSAQMVFAYLERPDLRPGAGVVSNNHFDQDGLVSVAVLTDPARALARRELLVDLAAAGDFATFRDRRAAVASMAIAAYADEARSPIGPASGGYDEWCAALYEELLGRLPELLDDPGRYRGLWEEELASLTESEKLLGAGEASIEEHPDLDLAVVTVPEWAPDQGGHRFGGGWVGGLHPMAVYNATSRFRVLTLRGRSYEFAYRYESWVQYRSRRPLPRVDLSGLADELTALEDVGRWVFDGVGTITPRLHLDGSDESRVAPDRFLALVTAGLATGTPAWDPYAASPAPAGSG